MKRTLLLLILILTVSCAGRYTRRMQVKVDAWAGKPITAVVQSWGPPTTVYEEAPYKVYVWHDVRVRGGGGQTINNPMATGPIPRTTRTPVYVRSRHYYRMFWVKSDGIVERGRFGRQE